MTPLHHERPAKSSSTGIVSLRIPTAIGFLATALFIVGLGISSFADEYAYFSQAYFTNLFWNGQTNDPAWLEYPAFDLPPLPKYLIGVSLRIAHFQSPGRDAAFIWYNDINTRFGNPEALLVARIPSAVLGAIGCVALYAIGAIAWNRRVGAVAALLLMANPLYGLLARRAMSDVPCEALLLTALAFAFWSWRRSIQGRFGLATGLAMLLAGLATGLALLCKFNALLVPLILAAWAAIALVWPAQTKTNLVIEEGENRNRSRLARLGFAAGTLAALVVMALTFVSLNPFMTAHPSVPLQGEMAAISQLGTWPRFVYQVRHRTDVSRGQKVQFPSYSLDRPGNKAAVVLIQGFGRFGPLGPRDGTDDSTQRFDWRQDWGALIWLPLVTVGFVIAAIEGRRQQKTGGLPTSWAVLTWIGIVFGVVTLYIPLAWDRYLLPIQSGACLLAALAACRGFEAANRFLRPNRHPQPEDST
jgi:hypothetical protein